MKTTIEITDDLLHAAKELAVAEKTTLRALVEAGLRQQIRERESAPYRLIDASVDGNGTQPGIQEGDWDTIRGLIYEGQGA